MRGIVILFVLISIACRSQAFFFNTKMNIQVVSHDRTLILSDTSVIWGLKHKRFYFVFIDRVLTFSITNNYRIFKDKKTRERAEFIRNWNVKRPNGPDRYYLIVDDVFNEPFIMRFYFDKDIGYIIFITSMMYSYPHYVFSTSNAKNFNELDK